MLKAPVSTLGAVRILGVTMWPCRVVLMVLLMLAASKPLNADESNLAKLRQQVAGQSQLLDEQQHVLDQQQLELQSLRQLFESQTSASQARSGYDKGFVITSPGEPRSDSDSFHLRFNSWMQLRHTVFDSDGVTADQNEVEFERLRLIFSGHVWSPGFRYFIQLDADSDQSETVDMLDYYVHYDLADIFDMEPDTIAIRAGKWKMPFNRARFESGRKMQLVDRGLSSVFFDINRSLGVGVITRNSVADRPVETHLALHNGFKTGAFQPVRVGELDRNVAVSGRIFSDLVGSWGKDGESDLTPHSCPAVRVGAGFARTKVDRDGLREFFRQRVVDSGATLASILPPEVHEYDIAFYSVDANMKYRGLSILTEYYFRQMNDFRGAAVSTLNDHGLLVQSGVFVIPERLELAARFTRIVGNSGSLGASDASSDEVSVGFNWYLRGHNAKLQFDVTHLNGAPLLDRALNVLPGDRGMFYRTQLQLAF